MDVFEAIMNLLAILMELLVAHRDKDKSVYEAALEKLVKIVPAYKDKWHKLVGLGIQFLITLCDIRRGREGIVFLTKDHYQKIEEEGIFYWKKVNIIGKINFTEISTVSTQIKGRRSIFARGF
jgi:hypothetical protein